jgi:hypothetical protein
MGRSGVNPPPLPPFEWKRAAAANATYQENAQRYTTISMGLVGLPKTMAPAFLQPGP